MGRNRTDVRDAATRPGGSRAGRGSRVMFVLRRTRSAPLRPASLLLAILIAVTVTTGLSSFGARALPAAVHQRLAAAPATPILVSGQIGAARARADQSAISASVRTALGGVPFTLASGRWLDQLALPRPHGASQAPLIQAPLIQAAVLSGVRAHAVLAAGTWPGPRRPGAPLGVVLPVSTAGLLHFSVGQVLALRDSLTGAPVRLRVTGLFRPRDPAGPYWRLSLLGTSGKLVQGTFVTYGPMLASPSALGPGGLPVSAASWLVTADTGRIPPGRVAGLAHRLSAVVASLRGNQSLGGLQVTTGLPQILAALARSLVVSRSLLLIGSLQLLLLATAAAALAARLLASQREEETALLSARGVARGQLVRASLAEAALLAVTGAVAGIAAGSYLAGRLLSASGLPGTRTAGGLPGLLGSGVAAGAWWPAVVIVAGVIVVVTWPALRPATPGEARLRRGRQAVLATAARAGLDAALIGLGVLALWELRRYSAAPRLAGGTLGIDPVLTVAPAVALAGISLLPLRILPLAARLLDGLSRRGRRLAAALASWQVSRRAVRDGSPVLLVVLAVATGTLVLAQHQSWRQSQLDQAAFAAGSDATVTLASPFPLGRGAVIAQARGVRTAMPAAAINSGFDVLAVDARKAARTVQLRPDLSALPAAALWGRITPGTAGPGLVLPGRPARLEVSARVRVPRGSHLGALSASLSVQDASGIVYSVPAGKLPADGRYHQLVTGLSGPGHGQASGPPAYPLRLLGLSLAYQLPGFPAPPYRTVAAQQATQRAERRAADAPAAVDIRALTVSARPSGSFPAAFAAPGRLGRWHAAASSATLADPRLTQGIQPAVASWRASPAAATLTFRPGAGDLIQVLGGPVLPVTGQLTLTAGSPRLPVPAIATRAFLAAAGDHLGQTIAVPVGTANVPVRLVAEVRAFPATGSAGPVVVMDLAALQEVLAAQSQPPLPVTQWWLTTAHGRVPPGLPAGATVVSWAGSAAQLLGDPLPNVPQLSLLVIVVAAGLLAGIGFLVSVVAAVRERQLQTALLAALGVGRAARAGQLGPEQLMLAVPGAAAGALIGAALAHLLVPAVTLTTGASAPFPPVQVVIPLGWTAWLALGVAAVPVLVAVVAAARPDPAAGLRAGETG
jgi:hypothetical protein